MIRKQENDVIKMAAKNDTRKKRVSKKNKKSWRKNTDTSDVDAFLDELRVEERQGGSLSSKPNEALFKLDTTAKKPGVLEDRPLLTKRERRKLVKPLRCFQALNNDSCIRDPLVKRNRVRMPGEGNIPEARKKREATKFLRKFTQATKHRAQENAERMTTRSKREAVQVDLWAENEVKLPSDSTWLRPQTLVHTEQHILKKIGKKPKAMSKKNSVTPAIEAPHPGESYNPSYKDHQELLQKVAEHELQLIKLEKHLERVTSKMYGKHSERPTEETRLKELAEGLPFLNEGPTVKKEEDSEDSDFRALNPPVQNRKKTLQKRRRLNEARVDKLKKQAIKVEKKKISDIQRIKKLEEEMAKEQAELDRLRALRDKMRERRALETKQMSHHKFKEPELDFTMPGELRGNIRNVHPEGNLVFDRFKSMQKRNVIETRVKQKLKRKYKLKRLTKPSHKITEEDLIMK